MWTCLAGAGHCSVHHKTKKLIQFPEPTVVVNGIKARHMLWLRREESYLAFAKSGLTIPDTSEVIPQGEKDE